MSIFDKFRRGAPIQAVKAAPPVPVAQPAPEPAVPHETPTESVLLDNPSWMRRDIKLPPWAKFSDGPLPTRRGPDGELVDVVTAVIDVDTAAATAEWLERLEVSQEQITQYWLEVAYQCVKMDVQLAIQGTELDPRIAAKPTAIHMLRADKYALKRYPAGRGIHVATQGREARGHYKRLRGVLPFA